MRPLRLAILLAAAAGAVARADQIRFPPALDRTGPIIAIWQPERPSPGTLSLDWTDATGRVLERHRIELTEPLPEVAVSIDPRRAVLPENRLEASFQPRGGGAPIHASTDFLARPDPGWRDYQVMLWQTPPPGSGATLHALGITGAKLLRPQSADGQALTRQFLADNLRWYVENLATDFYSAYHRWRPNLSVTWLFDTARARHRAQQGDLSVFARDPSLSDPAWLATVTARLSDMARQQAPYRPLFLNLGDETGIADLAAAWDFDLSPVSLDAMRDWLRGGYATLAALNRAWGTQFASWDAVQPALTGAAIRSDAAVPSWMDFKSWMDTSFARAVQAGTDAVHRGDPEALAGLEGTQVPGWGGYDYTKLAPASDVMEIYDEGNAVDIARSFNPRLRVLTTSFQGGQPELRRLWHELLLGGSGCIIWDDTGEVVQADGRPGKRAALLAPLWRKLGGALGSQMLDATPEPGQVAILYSQASFRLTWLLDRRREGGRWEDRNAEAETADNAWRAAGSRAMRLLSGLGAQPRWIAPETLASPNFPRSGTRVLILPHSIALSDEEVAAIRRFAQAGGLVLADTAPGERDALGHPRLAPPLAALMTSGMLRLPASLQTENAPPDEMQHLLDVAGVHRRVALTEADGKPAAHLDIHLFRSGTAVIAAIQRTDDAPGARALTLRLPAPQQVQLVGGESPSGMVQRLELQLDPVTPSLLVLSAKQLPGVTMQAPTQAALGDLVPIHLGLDGATAMDAHFANVSVLDPSGQTVAALSRTVRVPPQGCIWYWPIAVGDRPGVWHVQATDAITGRSVSAAVAVG